MTMYEEIEAMAIKKEIVTLDFLTAFKDKLREELGARYVEMPPERYSIEDGTLVAYVEVYFSPSKLNLFKKLEIRVAITTTSNTTVAMAIDRKKMEVKFDGESISESFKDAVKYTANLFKEKLNFRDTLIKDES